MRILHTADWHLKNPEAILEEVSRVCRFIASEVPKIMPDLVVIAGDTFDEMDGRIRLDSDATREGIHLITEIAKHAPVVIVQGTPSHDRNAPQFFAHLNTVFPVHVASDLSMVKMIHRSVCPPMFVPIDEPCDPEFVKAVITFLPHIGKQWMVAQREALGIVDGNLAFRELLHDALSGIGQINEQFDCPRVLVGHGMVTGARFSSGQEAVGIDLEFGVDDLRAAKCDYVALGHVHASQSFGPDIFYSGSPARLNFGEPEEKCFLVADVERGSVPVVQQFKTPARRFVMLDRTSGWEGPGAIFDAMREAAADIRGAHVRVRFVVPESEVGSLDVRDVEHLALDLGAVMVKVDRQVLPEARQRAAGISLDHTLQGKVRRWGEVTETDLPLEVLTVASEIEGMTIDELYSKTMKGEYDDCSQSAA